MKRFLLIGLILGGILMGETDIAAVESNDTQLDYDNIIETAKVQAQDLFTDLPDNLFWNEETREILFITENAKVDYFSVFDEFCRAIEIEPKKSEASRFEEKGNTLRE